MFGPLKNLVLKAGSGTEIVYYENRCGSLTSCEKEGWLEEAR